MLNPKRLLISLLGLAVFTAQSATAMKERIVFDPQIHKETPGDDPDFTAVPEAQQGPSVSALLKQQQQQQRVKDVNGALDFLADFARYEAKQSNKAPRRYEPEPEIVEADEDYQDQGDDEDDDNDNDDDFQREEADQFSSAYLQSLLGRNQELPAKPRQSKQMAAAALGAAAQIITETTTRQIATTKAPRAAALNQQQQQQLNPSSAGGVDFLMIGLLTCLAVAAAVGVIVSVFCFVKIQKRSRSTQRYDYSGPGNGGALSGKKGTGSHDSLSNSAASAAASKLSAIFGGSAGSASNVDKKLANNATLYHFEHHKKEMMAAESADVPAEFGDSDAESGDENDENDYTVYECPGLAPTGEMQVDNPLFRIKQQATQPGAATNTSAPAAASRASPPVVVHGMQPSGSPK